jgi:hypothetical protein
MERPNLSVVRAKLMKIKDYETQESIKQLLNYVEKLEKMPIEMRTKPSTRLMKAKDYQARIDYKKLPHDANEEEEERLSFLVKRVVEYALHLEKQHKIS